ncbi:polysaccharide lyase family 7 protein [Isoptericola halotolerans]|uniref:polysaccharide lyase family 7 protein n=1 Tax=Isoptericola halotolerans TaxID=300560 RepID=UPI00388E6E89
MRLHRKHGLAATMLATTVFVAAQLGGIGSATAADPCDYPAQQVDLENWKVTLPTGSGNSPTEIKQPDLEDFSVAPWFQVNSKCTGIQFRAAVNGVTTSGSGYPRSELREMTDGGTERAAWSSTSGTHTMTFRTAVNHLPEDKPHVVVGQIHDGDDDVTVFRVEGDNLYITKGNDTHHKLVTSNYQMHQVFEGKFVVSDGEIEVYYNGVLQTTIDHAKSGNYFKAGAYTQANCGNSSPCSSSNYGQATLYKLQVKHS